MHAKKIICQTGTLKADLIAANPFTKDNNVVALTLNAYDRVYLNWFKSRMYTETSFEDFVRYKLYFSFNTYNSLRPLDLELEGFSDLFLVKQEGLPSDDSIFRHYCDHP